MADDRIRLLDRDLGGRRSLPKDNRKSHRDTTSNDLGSRSSLPKNNGKIHRDTTSNHLEDGRSPPKDDRKSQIDAALTQLREDVNNLENKLAQLKQQPQEQANHQRRINEGVQQLEVQAERINLLATQLEAAMLKFNQIARKVNRAYRAIQQLPDLKALSEDESRRHRRPLNIWEIHHSAVPTVVKRCSQFLLTARQVDLLTAEHEDEVQRRAEAAQRRQEALEAWLAEKQGH